MTTLTAARHSMGAPDWYTPREIVEAAREVMGGIDFDPCSDETANLVIGARRIYTTERDGLQGVWSGRMLVNPPGGLVNQFWAKLMTTAHQWAGQPSFQAIWIGYSLEQLQTLQQAQTMRTPLDFTLCVPAKRIAFVENAARRAAREAKVREAGEIPRAKSSPSHGNYITYIGPLAARFADIFRQFGQVRV